ncbi:MAG: hypothetical protein NW216_14980 [Hyphomicrobium sp.]|nr:hypothetical protein [Hyphomicrobium sp.]
MRKMMMAVIAGASALAAYGPATAAPWSATQGQGWQMEEIAPRSKASRKYAKRMVSAERASYGRSSGAGPRPRKWCGWWMRTQKGGGPEYNVAWNWRNYGSPAGGPMVGAVVVWRHHVGMIVGRSDNGMWIVKSGNDGGAVRTRARSVKGAVFRI